MFTRSLHLAVAFAAVILLATVIDVTTVDSQGLAPAPSSVQHVTVRPGASAPSALPGGTVSLWVDVTPNAKIHVYAPGAKDFEPVKLVLSPLAGVEMGRPIYPAGILTQLPGVPTRVPVYNTAFRVTAPMTIAKMRAHGGALIVSGALNYQACDDRVCFPPASLPVFWRIEIK